MWGNRMRSSELQTRISKIANKEAALAAIFATRKLNGYEDAVLECIEAKLEEEKTAKKIEKLLEPLQDAQKRKIVEVLLSSFDNLLVDLIKMHGGTIDYLKTSPRFHKKQKERLDRILITVDNKDGYMARLEKLQGIMAKLAQLGLEPNKLVKLKLGDLDSKFKRLRNELNNSISVDLSSVCKFLYR